MRAGVGIAPLGARAEKRSSRETALRAKRGAPFAATRDRVMKPVPELPNLFPRQRPLELFHPLIDLRPTALFGGQLLRES